MIPSHMCQKKVVLREFSLFGTGLRKGGGSEKPRGEENAERECVHRVLRFNNQRGTKHNKIVETDS
jgi:hypothetical protein